MPDEILPTTPEPSTLSTDPAHLFMQLYDFLPEELFLGREPTEWRDDDEVVERADAVTDLVLRRGTVPYADLASLVRWSGHQGLFTILLGLDGALLFANPFAGAFEQFALVSVAGRYAETGLFNDPKVVPGALLPRSAMPSEPRGRGHKEDFFAVHRIPAAMWDRVVRYRPMPARYQPAFVPGEPVKVGCAPLLQSYEEIGLTLDEHGGRTPRYRMNPADLADAPDRIVRIIDAMDAAGARIGVMPEGCLSDKLLAQWQVTAQETAQRDKPLRWLLVGSGPLDDEEPPVNRTVLLDRWTGDVLLTHDKTERFTMTDDQVTAWRLPWPKLGRPVEEDIVRGRTVEVRETGFGRLTALICEDLNQSTGWERELAAFGVSHLLVPIFSKPILRYRWEHQAAERQVRNLGAWVVVSNSLVVATAIAEKGGTGETTGAEHGSTCLVFGPVEARRRTRYGVQEQFGLASAVDDLGWLARVDEQTGRFEVVPGVLPEMLPGVVYPEWFGGGWTGT